MNVLSSLQPEAVFRYFEELAGMPHGSGNTAAVTEYLKKFAEDHGYRCRADEKGNVVIFADGSEGYEEAPAVILQGHMDMVCVKKADCTHDFTSEPLKLAVDGDLILAEGTSLGGDDGVAVAYMLAILDDPSIAHPPLDCIFTTDEEIGMLGADAFDTKDIRGHLMINLDSEDEGVFTCGCAGGGRVDTVLPIQRDRIKGLPVLVTLDGLKGGHSGSAIGTGRASANKLMGRFLYALADKTAYSVENISGGEKDNAIAVSAKAHLVVDEEDFGVLEAFASAFEADIRSEFEGIEDSFSVSVTKGDVHRIAVMDPVSQDKAIQLLLLAPYGVREMSGVLEGVTQTSSNPGIVRTTEKEFICGNLVRSSVPQGRELLIAELRALAELAGALVRVSACYPEWAYRSNSPLQQKAGDIYREMYGKEPVFDVVHGGVECGVFSKKIRDFDAVSIGPDMRDIHTADERLSISSTARVFEFLIRLLAAMK